MVPTIQIGEVPVEKRSPKPGERKAELICKVKYCNTLPDIPFDLKFIPYQFDVMSLIKYHPTSLERNYYALKKKAYTARNQTRHKQNHCPSRELNHKCTICKKVFISPKNLRDHMRIHNKDQPYAGSKCDQSFTPK